MTEPATRYFMVGEGWGKGVPPGVRGRRPGGQVYPPAAGVTTATAVAADPRGVFACPASRAAPIFKGDIPRSPREPAMNEDRWDDARRLEAWAGEVRVNLVRVAALVAFYGYHLLNVYALSDDPAL